MPTNPTSAPPFSKMTRTRCAHFVVWITCAIIINPNQSETYWYIKAPLWCWCSKRGARYHSAQTHALAQIYDRCEMEKGGANTGPTRLLDTTTRRLVWENTFIRFKSSHQQTAQSPNIKREQRDVNHTLSFSYWLLVHHCATSTYPTATPRNCHLIQHRIVKRHQTYIPSFLLLCGGTVVWLLLLLHADVGGALLRSRGLLPNGDHLCSNTCAIHVRSDLLTSAQKQKS